MEICDTLPYTQKIADDICLVRTMHTEAINHDPAITFMNTGNQQPGPKPLPLLRPLQKTPEQKNMMR